MSSQMPVAEAVKKMIANETPLSFIDRDGSAAIFPTVSKAINQAVFFNIDVAHDIFLNQWENKRIPEPTTIPARNPYPATWFEWRDELLKRNVGVLVQEPNPDFHQLSPAHNPDGSFLLAFTLRDEAQQTGISPVEGSMKLKDGQFERLEVQGIAEIREDDNAYEVFSYYHLNVLTALGLIHCKNVTTKENQIRFARNGTQKRRREPATEIRYRTIVLPGGGTQTDSSGNHRATAIHRVRGHFKTFTTERPLLGKHVGTYWWGWQVRGNPELGSVISDYKIGSNA